MDGEQSALAREVYLLITALTGVERDKAERALAKALRVGLKSVRASVTEAIKGQEPAKDVAPDPLRDLIEKQGVIRTVAEEIQRTAFFAQDVGERLYHFSHGVYVPDGLAYVKRRVKAILEDWDLSAEWSDHCATEVAEYIRVDAPQLWDRPPRDVLNLKNGLLHIETRELLDHDPSHLSTVQIPITYNVLASCSNWQSFSKSVFPEDSQELAYEIPAWLMCPDESIQRAILLQGTGGNGKSTYLRALIAFLGRSNIASLSLQKLELDRFAVSRLMGKLANVCPDLPSKHLEDTGLFKAITGGDIITGEYKYKESFDFLPFARMIFSANHFPRSTDDSEAFFERWHVIPFERAFRGTAEEIPRDILDAQLAHPDELSGVLNKALDALARVRKQGFSLGKSMTKAWEEFRRTTDPMTVWLERMVERSPEAKVPKDQLTQEYNKDCDRTGRPRISSHAMTKAIKRAFPEVTEGQRMVSGDLKWCWLGMGLRAKELKDKEK